MATHVKYLTLKDYYTTIQKNQLEAQLLDSLNINSMQRIAAEAWAIGHVRSHLSNEYDLDFELTNTLPYDYKKVYYGGDRVVIDYDDWVSSSTYKQGDCVIKDNIGYIAISNVPSGEWNESFWNQIGYKFDIWYISYPYPVFQLEPKTPKNTYTDGYYRVGDKVWWNNKIYECIRESSLASHETLIQYNAYPTLYPNVFPDDESRGLSQWKFVEDFSIPKEEFPALSADGAEPNKWTLGDNRDQILVQVIIDLTLWRLHSRISPMNIPKLREDNKNASFAWLRGVKNGELNTDLPLLQPAQGDDIVWGSKPKVVNGYGDEL